MPRSIHASRSGTHAVRALAVHWIARAARELQRSRPSDAAVHEARKDIKKARAAVKLLRRALGSRIYRRENTLLRDAARTLNPVRDARVLIQTLERTCGQRRGGKPDLLAALALRRRLSEQETAARRQLRGESGRLSAIRALLKAAEQRAADWRVGRHGWSALGPGLAHVYRAGRRAARVVQRAPTDEALHEWRKQAKSLCYCLRMLAPIAPRRMGALADQARRLAECLGTDHDLALLCGRLPRESAALAALRETIEKQRRSLQSRARMLGARLYRHKPEALMARLGQDWRVWHDRAQS